MLEAIDAPDGRASGVLRGPIADQFAATTRSTSPVEIDVTTLHGFRQEGCKRLNVRLKQANVPAKDGKSAEFGIDYGVNLCRDGSPPTLTWPRKMCVRQWPKSRVCHDSVTLIEKKQKRSRLESRLSY